MGTDTHKEVMNHPYRTPSPPAKVEQQDPEPESAEARSFLAAYLMLMLMVMFGGKDDDE